MTRIDRNADPITHGTDLRLEYRGEPFTGEVVERAGEQLLSQEFYVDGVPHGPTREWWPDGRRRAEGEMRHGLPHGTHRRWYADGRPEAERDFDEAGRLVSVRRWDEDGNPVEPGGRARRLSR